MKIIKTVLIIFILAVFTNINGNALKSNIISGQIKLQDSIVAKQNMQIYLDVYDEFHGKHYETWPVIYEGTNNAKFNFDLKNNQLKRIKIRYFSDYAGFVRSGFYTAKGMVRYYQMSQDIYLDPTKDTLNNITITLLSDETVEAEDDLIKTGKAKTKQVADNIIKPYYTEFEKALVIHDYITENFEYFTEEIAIKRKLSAAQDSYHKFLPILYNVAVCGGYADTAENFMTLAGLKSRTINALPEVDHAWNEVMIDNNYYLFDTTIDDTFHNYERFMISDKQLIKIVFSNYNKKTDEVWDTKLYGNYRKLIFHFKDEMYPNKKELSSKEFRRIFGNFLMPEKLKAGKDGITIKINDTSFHIPPNERSTFFALKLPVKEYINGYTLRYTIDSDEFVGGEFKVIESSGNITKVFDLNGVDITGINIILEKNNRR